MTYLVNSDLAIDWLDGSDVAHSMLNPLIPIGLAISVITLMEILDGLPGSAKSVQARFDELVEESQLHPVTSDTAAIAATVRRQLRAAKAPVNHRALDILIAATAIEHDLILVTRNTRHFLDIEGLRLLPSALE